LIVTNDDGIDSPGIRALARALDESYEVVVAAPAAAMSGSGTAIGRLDPEVGVDLRRADFDGITAYAVAGPPGLAVTAAALGAFGSPPDLVVSGVNAGINTGHSIIHSGTVGAVLTARTFQSRGLAVSLATSEPWHWDTAAEVALSATDWILRRRKHGCVLNVNVPGRPVEQLLGIRWADLDAFGHFSVATADVAKEKLQFEVAGSASGLDPASDTALCADGYVTVTLLSAIEPQPFPAEEATAVWCPDRPGPSPVGVRREPGR
jgi:5'-nucleotidase